MKTALHWLFWVALAAVIAVPFALFYAVLSPTPAVTANAKPTAADIARLAELVRQHTTSAGPDLRNLRLSARDLELALDHQLHRVQPPPPVAIDLALGDDALRAAVTVTLPLAIARHYINLRAVLVPHGNTLKLTRLAAGALTLPQFVVERAQQRLQRELARAAPSQVDLRHAIARLAIRNGELIVDYRRDSDLAKLIAAGQRDLLASQLDEPAVTLYADELGRLALQRGGRIALHEALPALFATATRRIAADGAPVAENRALLAALALYAADPKVLSLARLGDDFPRPPADLRVTLHGRADLARHYITSATLALIAGTDMADAAGLYKETADAGGGTGFDIADLVADRAGTMLAQLATRDASSARRAARTFAGIERDAELMPAPGDPRIKAMVHQLVDADSSQLDGAIADINRRIGVLIRDLPLYAGLQ